MKNETSGGRGQSQSSGARERELGEPLLVGQMHVLESRGQVSPDWSEARPSKGVRDLR